MAFSISWPRLLRRAARVLAAFAGVILAVWLSLAWYVHAHKEEILKSVAKTLGERMRGDLKIRSMDASLFRDFPNVSMSLKDVSLHDSLWTQHKHSLLEATDVFVRINPVALLSRRVELRKITVAHGSIFLYTDSAGYSNAYLLERKDTSKKNRTALVDYFGMEDVHFWFVNSIKQKRFHLYFKSLDGRSSQTGGVIQTHLTASAHVFEMAFSTIRGSYLKDQDLRLDMRLYYRISDKHLHIPQRELRISGTPILLGGDFYFNRTPAAFAIHISGKNLPYKTAFSWSSANIQKSLKAYSFEKPISIEVEVSGLMQYHNIPLIKITYPISDNTLITPLGNIEHLTYTGEYFNEAIPGAGHGDDNSRIALYAYKGQWQGIPFSGDTLAVINLLRPVVKAHITSAFPLPSLNNVMDGEVMSFERGKADADIRYDGGILPDDPTPYSINGYARVSDAAITYLPRNLAFNNVGATLYFKGDDLFFRNISLRSKQSSVTMEGDALHFLRLYFTDPGKVAVAWRVRSPFINMNDYAGFFAKRKRMAAAPGRGAPAANRITTQLDRVLESAGVSVDARLERVVYKSFNADGIIARCTLDQQGILLQQAQIRSGGGALNVSGVINQAARDNPFHIKAQVRNADVAKFFTSFDNFGQDAITADNLVGRINADADISGNVTDAGTLLKNSLNGQLSFRLEDGQINHFAPFEKVGKVIFKKRNLSAVAVKELAGNVEIAGNKIFIRPMDIQTSVVNMMVQGVYGLGGGTDIAIEVPLRNPEKEGAATPVGMLLRRGKGFTVHLRAQDPTGAGVKIGWDPMKHGQKTTGEILQSQ